jgi:hypothetical protein
MSEGNYQTEPFIPIPGYLSSSAIGFPPATDYSATGAMGIWRMRSVDQIADTVNNGDEQYLAIRKTKWFPIGTYEQPKKIRRIRLNYKSKGDVTVSVYTDYIDDISGGSAGVLIFPGTGTLGTVAIQKMVHKRLFTRARSIQLKIQTTMQNNNYCLIYGIEIEVDDE